MIFRALNEWEVATVLAWSASQLRSTWWVYSSYGTDVLRNALRRRPNYWWFRADYELFSSPGDCDVQVPRVHCWGMRITATSASNPFSNRVLPTALQVIERPWCLFRSRATTTVRFIEGTGSLSSRQHCFLTNFKTSGRIRRNFITTLPQAGVLFLLTITYGKCTAEVVGTNLLWMVGISDSFDWNTH